MGAVKPVNAGLATSSMRAARPPAADSISCALFCGSLIVPEEGGAEGFGTIAQKYAAVHLPGEADGGDVGGFDASAFTDGFCRGDRCFPPIERILLGPSWFGRRDGVFRHGGGEDFSFGVADECFGSAGADVDAEQVRHG